MAQRSDETVIGRITSVFGVKGWVKVYSYTDPIDGILNYPKWTAVFEGRRSALDVLEGKRHGPGIIVQLKGVSDRDQAKALCGVEIVVPTASLPALPEGEYYWYQLEGLRVETLEGVLLGQVSHLLETGSNDVLVVKGCDGSVDQRERLIPYIPDDVVKSVSLDDGRMMVDWDPEF
ncbi:MAG: ribosome maturation factor RimM [Marinobacter sp.]|nr:ribosome maturation factor RimM [Marinobacter sp.]